MSTHKIAKQKKNLQILNFEGHMSVICNNSNYSYKVEKKMSTVEQRKCTSLFVLLDFLIVQDQVSNQTKENLRLCKRRKIMEKNIMWEYRCESQEGPFKI